MTHRTAVLLVVLVSYLMIILDGSIVITALPKIQHGLGFTAAGLSWVQNAYTLAFGGLLLLGARAGDILGRRRMFVIGLGLFTASSLAVGAAQSAEWLLLGRAIQGIGAAILAPSTLALLSTSFPHGEQRTRAMAYYGATAGVGSTIGLVLGGAIAEWASWRVGFFINLPIGILLMLGARRYIAETERGSGRFDLPGAVSSTLGMTALVYGIVRAADAGWSDPVTIAALIAGIVLLVLFVLVESRASQPVLPLRLFASRERAGAYATRVLFMAAMSGFWFVTTQFLQGVMGYSPLEAGLAYLPTTVANFAAAMAVPRLTRRFGNAPLLVGGVVVAFAGLAWLAWASANAPTVAGMALPMILIGLGQGICISPLTVAGVAGVASDDAGAASGLVNVAHQFGISFGLGVLTVVYTSASAGARTVSGSLARGVPASLSAGSVMLFIALVLAAASIVGSRRAEGGRVEGGLAPERAA